jgi:hypothetical protein
VALTLNDLIAPQPQEPTGSLGLARYKQVLDPAARPESPIERYRRIQPNTAAAVETPEQAREPIATGHPANDMLSGGLASVPTQARSPAPTPAPSTAPTQAPTQAPAPTQEQPRQMTAAERFDAMRPAPRPTTQPVGNMSAADVINAKYAGPWEAG